MNNPVKRCVWSSAEIAALVASIKENNVIKLLDGKRFLGNADVSNKTDFLMKF